MNSCHEGAWKIICSGVSSTCDVSLPLVIENIMLIDLSRMGYSMTATIVHISGGSYFQPLSWTLRLKVALGAAKGLAFLHSAETRVIYRDFKTSNILLDSV